MKNIEKELIGILNLVDHRIESEIEMLKFEEEKIKPVVENINKTKKEIEKEEKDFLNLSSNFDLKFEETSKKIRNKNKINFDNEENISSKLDDMLSKI